jgi:hypothetical protein
MKARNVKGLDPAGALADNAEKIVRVRLDELHSFMPQASDPSEEQALHDMRIAAKRLRYILEITHPCFGPYAESAVKKVKDLQDVLGEIHDCDVLLPDVRGFIDELVARDGEALVERAGEAEDLDPKLVREAPSRTAYAGLVSLATHLTARRQLLFTRFLELWQDYERKGFRSRVEFAVSERAGDTIAAT